ncbi:MAG: hypothetical protein ACT4P3_12765 [Betaproteobacteria bacterium]
MLQAAADQTICLHADDDDVIARAEMKGIPAGRKIAVRDIAPGAPVRRYNQIIGFASRSRSAPRRRAARPISSRSTSSPRR